MILNVILYFKFDIGINAQSLISDQIRAFRRHGGHVSLSYRKRGWIISQRFVGYSATAYFLNWVGLSKLFGLQDVFILQSFFYMFTPLCLRCSSIAR